MFSTTELQVLRGLRSGRTLSQIGEELALSHPSVSKTLRAAEQKAGLKLTEQHGRRLRLTPDGARLADAAQEVLLKLRELDTALASIKTGDSGVLRIVASNSVCSHVLPPVVNQLLAAVKEVDIRIQGVDGSGDIWEIFDTEEFDVAIARTLPPPHLTATHLFDDELCLCVAADSELARRTEIHWSELSQYTLIGPMADDALWRQFSMFGIRPRRRIQLSNAVLTRRFVEDSQSLALLYRSVALEEQAGQRRIAILRVPEAAPTTVSYWMATRTPAGASPLLQRFVDLVQAHARSFSD
jgi:LysR family transcriptional regulator for metE and metH